MAKTYTERGFATYAEFTDTYGAKVTVRQSSADPLDKLWVFVKGGTLTGNDGSGHLSVEQATQLRDALTEWIHDMEADEAQEAKLR